MSSILGPADDQSALRRPLYLLRYGAAEFGFKPIPDTDDSRLVSTAIHFGRMDRQLPPSLRPADWIPTNETSVEEFRKFLDHAGIQGHSNVQGEQEYLVLDSGASVVFVQGRLHSIHFKRNDKKPERKQMTVSLPEQTVQQLRQRAREERMSVHELIENLIIKAST